MKVYFKLIVIILFLPNFCFSQYAAPFQKSSKWPFKDIKIGFDNPSNENSLQRRWVKEAIETSWQAVCQLNFTGWNESDNSCNLRIYIANDNTTRPVTARLGCLNNKNPHAIILNSNWYNIYCGDLANDIEQCFKAVVVHEFGHALGFEHEHANRNCCQPTGGDAGGSDIIDPTSDDWIVNLVCDEKSVMSYCNTLYNNHGNLSDGDISLVQQVYGKRNVSENTIIARDLFSINNSSFDDYNQITYRAFKTGYGTYRLYLKQQETNQDDGFTFSRFSSLISSSFSAYSNTTLEFDFKINTFTANTDYAFGLMFDLHDVSSGYCRGGNFYLLALICNSTNNTLYSCIKRRTNCQINHGFDAENIGYISSTNLSSGFNKCKIKKAGYTYSIYLNDILSCSFIYNGYLNFQHFLYQPGDCEISNIIVRKITD